MIAPSCSSPVMCPSNCPRELNTVISCATCICATFLSTLAFSQPVFSMKMEQALLQSYSLPIILHADYFNALMAVQMTGGAPTMAFGPSHPDTFYPDLEWLQQELDGPHPPKLVYLVNPSNPSGDHNGVLRGNTVASNLSTLLTFSCISHLLVAVLQACSPAQQSAGEGSWLPACRFEYGYKRVSAIA